MKKGIFLLCSFLLIACKPSTDEAISNLNGYWQIESAELPEGITKNYNFSALVDFIEVKENKGIRKKVQPQLGGRFISSEDAEVFEIKVENDSINLYYTTPYDAWKETVISSEEDELIILNPNGIIYTYKRFTPFTDYGEENQ